MNNSIYKIYQLLEFFINRYQYINYLIKELNKPGEVWLFSKTNKSYNVIRVSNYPLDYLKSDKERIEEIIKAVSKQRGVKNPSFLDLHISKEEVLEEDNIFNVSCIDIGFNSGINLENIYPGINNVLHEVDNQEAEIKRVLTSINQTRADYIKQRAQRLRNMITFRKPSWTMAIISICISMFIAEVVLERNYDQTTALIFLGADYKMFTIGLQEYWRLFTSAFLHSSFLHIFVNLFTLYNFGPQLEDELGHTKYIILFVSGILISSLTHSALVGNSISIGLSGGIYAIFIYYIVQALTKGFINKQSLYFFLILNIAINFLPNVAWQSHLGGAICGLLFCYVYDEDKKINYYLLPLIPLLIFGLFYKCVKDDNITPYYGATDLDVVNMYNNLGMKDHALKIESKLYEIYFKED